MLTFLFPVITKKINVEELVKSLSAFSHMPIEIIFACHKGSYIVDAVKDLKKISDSQIKVIVKQFRSDICEEDMIESCISKIHTGNLFLVRDKENNFDVLTLQKMLMKQKEGYDTVLCKSPKKENFILKFIKSAFFKMIRLMFNINFYNGEIGLELFSSRALSVLKVNGSAFLTKMNRWVGIDTGYVESNQTKLKFKPKKLDFVRNLAIIFTVLFEISLAIIITLGILLKLQWLVILISVFVVLIFFTLALYNIFKTYILIRLGIFTGFSQTVLEEFEVVL